MRVVTEGRQAPWGGAFGAVGLRVPGPGPYIEAEPPLTAPSVADPRRGGGGASNRSIADAVVASLAGRPPRASGALGPAGRPA